MQTSCKIEGIEGVNNRLHALANELAAEAIRAALRAGGEVIKTEVAARTPVDSGLLLENIESKEAESAKLQQAAVVIGFGEQGYIARFVEFGHLTTATHAGKLKHVAARPFMRNAMDSCHDEAVDVFAETLKQKIEAS